MAVSKYDEAVIDFFNSNELQTVDESLAEFSILIDTLLYLNELLSEQRIAIEGWQKYSETLLHKFSLHALSIHKIASGIKLNSVYFKPVLENIELIDISTVKTVLRSALEALLMYYFIYINPTTKDEKKLRHFAWLYSALLDRQSFPQQTIFAQQQLENDKKEIEILKREITQLTSYQNLSEKQKVALIEKGNGKLFHHWSKILEETGFSEKNSIYVMYSYLSIYSHSEGLSAIQLYEQGYNYQKNKNELNLDIHISKILTSLMIAGLIKFFPIVKDRFLSLPLHIQISIDLYTKMAFTMKSI